MRRWTPPYFYNLSSSNFTDSFSSLAIYRPDYKFYPNSANRIYYYARANETSGYAPKFSLYNVTTQSYIATYNLDKASGNTYEINGYVPGLSGSQYYTISLSCGSTNMTNGYVVVSWSSI